MEGFLQVPKGGKWKDDSKRYFVVDSARAALCSGKTDAAARGSSAKRIPFHNLLTVQVGKENPCLLTLTTKKKTYEFRTSNESDALLWKRSIEENIQGSSKPPPRTSLFKRLSVRRSSVRRNERSSVDRRSQRPAEVPAKAQPHQAKNTAIWPTQSSKLVNEAIVTGVILVVFILVLLVLFLLTPSISRKHKVPGHAATAVMPKYENIVAEASMAAPIIAADLPVIAQSAGPRVSTMLKVKIIIGAVVLVVIVLTGVLGYVFRHRIKKVIMDKVEEATPSWLRSSKKKQKKRDSASRSSKKGSSHHAEVNQRKLLEEQLARAETLRSRQQAVEKALASPTRVPQSPQTRANPTSLAAAAAAIAQSRRNLHESDAEETPDRNTEKRRSSKRREASPVPASTKESAAVENSASSKKRPSNAGLAEKKKGGGLFGMIFGSSSSSKKKSSSSRRSSTKNLPPQPGKLSPSSLNLSFNSTRPSQLEEVAPQETGGQTGAGAKLVGAKYAKYAAMLKAGLPEGAVRNAMARDGVPEPKGAFESEDLYGGSNADIKSQIKQTKKHSPVAPRGIPQGGGGSAGGAMIEELRMRQQAWGLASDADE